MRVMGVKGLTLYHLKSHLQKFRLGKQPHKEFSEHSTRDGERALELQRNTASSSGIMGRSMNEMQMEVQRRLHEQLEVQRHLQLRIEAQGKYMQTILEKACQKLAGENMASGSYKGPAGNQAVPVPDIEAMKDFGSPVSFPSLQDLNIYGGGEHLVHQQNMDRSSSFDGFMQNNENICLGKKRPNSSYGAGAVAGAGGKSPLMWTTEDFRLQELGTAASCLSSRDDPFKAY
ncbi:Myb transcription factor ipn2 [Sarracenia purpurea var. burkii]